MSPEGRLVLLLSTLESLWAASTGKSPRQRKDTPMRHKLTDLAEAAERFRSCPEVQNQDVLLPQGRSTWAAELVSLRNQLAHSGTTGTVSGAGLEDLAERSFSVLHGALLHHLNTPGCTPGASAR
ncbi:hypothetical protein GCM10009674_15630 [Nesterenkonia xinjiangensis]